MIKLNNETENLLMGLSKEKGVFLEGNILKIIDTSKSEEFKSYIEEATEKDKETRRKRLEVTKQIQEQNNSLRIVSEKLESALKSAESAKEIAEKDLDVARKKTQYQLIRQIVIVALYLVVGIGVATTALYIVSMSLNQDTETIRNMWSSMFGIILTNSFSIIGTIMGIKYGNGSKDKSD